MAVSTWRRGSAAAAGVLGVSLALAACGGSGSTAAGGTTAASSGGSTAAASSASAGGDASGECAPYAEFGKFEGKTVNVFSPIRDDGQKDQEAAQATFEKCTGIKIVWEGSGEFETQLPIRVQGGTAPDIATIPQPGLLATLVQKYKAIKPLPDKLKATAEANFSKDWLNYGTVDGTLYAAPFGANVKSFVWYSPKMFKDNGWAVPTTWDEMLKLSDTIAAKGIKPWCAGFESGVATGWPGTDWIEDLMLRTTTPETYDKWVTHGIPFNDPAVVAAFDKAGAILKNDKYVNGGLGGVKTIATTSFQDGGQPILDGQCAMHRQASFYASLWPKGTTVGPEGQVFAFYLPAVDPAKGKPVLGGGEVDAAFNDKPETQAVLAYYLSAQAANDRALVGDWISANKGLKKENVVLRGTKDPNPVLQLSVDILQDPNAVFRFDGSDLMPSAVGSGTFWKGITKWVNGADTKSVTDEIEASWPKS